MSQESHEDLLQRRRDMIERHLKSRGIDAPDVIEAMKLTPREHFVPGTMKKEAYDDRALPIQCGQTISQPYMVAYMTQALDVRPSSRVLEIGTGSGYQTAILARLCRQVYSVERVPALHRQAATTLGTMSVANVTLVIGDGSQGLPAHAPFDRIIITAGAPKAPESLLRQLVDGGRLILPVGGKGEQTITWYDRQGEGWSQESGIGCRFVRLIGEEGWPD